MNTIFIVLPILIVLMFQIGLELKLDSFLLLVKQPKALLIGLFAHLFVLPLFAFLYAYLFNLETVFFIGLFLIACAPSGSASNIISLLAKGNLALAVSLTVISSMLTLISTPIILTLVIEYLGSLHMTTIKLPIGSLIMQNIIVVLVPMLLGIVCKHYLPNIANTIHTFLGKIVFPALLFLVTVFFIQHYSTILDNIGILGGCIALFLASTLFSGNTLANLCKLQEQEKRTIVIETGIQNAAQAIMLATSPLVFNNEKMAIPAIIYALLMNLVILPYAKIMEKRGG